MARRSRPPRPRHSAERVYVAISVLALVVAVVGVVVGVRSSSADFIVFTTTPGNTLTTLNPAAPGTSPAATRPAGVVRLTWTASATEATHAVTYSVFRRPTGAGSYALIAGPFSAYTHDDTPPIDGSYDYVVRANVSTFSSDDSAARVGLSDRTAPVSSLTCNGSACSSSTWYTAAISVVLSATDAGTGVASVTRSVDGGSATTGASPSSFTVSGDSATHSVAHYGTDVAGNVASSTSQTLKIDGTAPTISGAPSPAANGAGWNNSNITVTYACADALSGISTCTSPVVLSTEGTGLSSSGTAVDVAGNSASTTVSGLKLDKTAPTISGAATPAANGAGWRTSDVTVTYTCSDGLSGLSTCTAPVTLSSEGADQSSSGTAVDVAGNSAGTTVSGINIDKTAPTTPVLTLTSGPLLGAATVEAVWTASADATSGVSGYTIRWVQAGTCPAPSVANYPDSASTAAGQTTYSIPGTLLANYCAYVIAADVAGNSANSAAAGPATAR